MMREAAIFGKNCRQNENPGELGLASFTHNFIQLFVFNYLRDRILLKYRLKKAK